MFQIGVRKVIFKAWLIKGQSLQRYDTPCRSFRYQKVASVPSHSAGLDRKCLRPFKALVRIVVELCLRSMKRTYARSSRSQPP